MVQLVTNGMKITDYRPPDSDTPVDIIVRVPEDRRTLNQIDALEISTPAGSVPDQQFRHTACRRSASALINPRGTASASSR